MGDTYVNYGLGNFLWYHNHQPESGVLRLRIRDGEVVDDSWIPALIQTLRPSGPAQRRPRADAVADWRRAPRLYAASRPGPRPDECLAVSRVVVLLVLLLGACSAAPDPTEVGGPHDRATVPSGFGQRRTPARSTTRRRAYSASVRPIGPALRDRMRYSHRPGCPVRMEGPALSSG